MKSLRFALLVMIIALVTVSGAVLAQDDMMELPEPVESGMAPVNDIEVYYAIYGEGDPLLLLHGGLGHSDEWVNQIEAFAAEYEVIVMDSRGHGRSTMSEQPITYSLMASDVLQLMDFLEIESASIVGFSDGGIIGMDIAINNPDRLDVLVAYGANYNFNGVLPTVLENERFLVYVDDMIADYAEMSPDPDGFEAFFANIGNMWATEPEFTPEQLATITAPTLVLAGWDEEAIDPNHTVEMAALIPTAELSMLPNTGQFALEEVPERFNELILGYLATAE